MKHTKTIWRLSIVAPLLGWGALCLLSPTTIACDLARSRSEPSDNVPLALGFSDGGGGSNPPDVAYSSPATPPDATPDVGVRSTLHPDSDAARPPPPPGPPDGSGFLKGPPR